MDLNSIKNFFLQRKNELTILSSAFLFIVISITGLHGFSLSMWHNLLDGSKAQEIIFGNPQPIRSDDYNVVLPLALAQRNTTPPFSKINDNISYGANALVNFPLPVYHWSSFFRPHMWGYFFGADFGLSWNWQFRAIGLFVIGFLLFNFFSKGKFILSLAAAIWLVFTPYFQFWSYYFEPTLFYGGLAFLGTVSLFNSTRIWKQVIFGFLIFGCALAFAFLFYPPNQIQISLFFTGLTIAYFIENYRSQNFQDKLAIKTVIFSISLALTICCLALYFQENWQDIKLLTNTEYPGKRILSGGSFTFPWIFNTLFFTYLKIENWRYLANICESSGGYLFFPLIITSSLIMAFRKWEAVTPTFIFLCLYIGYLLTWAMAGLPPSLAKWTFSDKVLPHRMAFGLLVANYCLLALHFSKPPSSKYFQKDRWFYFCLFIWILFLLTVGIQLKNLFKEISISFLLVIGIFWTAIGWMLLLRKKISIFLLALAAICSTFSFNPLVIGGTRYLQYNQLSRAIVELDRKKSNSSNWVSFNSGTTPNLFRILGVRAVNGLHFYPIFDLWKVLDPEGKYYNHYNRYAHVEFYPSQDDNIDIQNPFPDRVRVYLPIKRAWFDKLGVDYIVSHGPSLITGPAQDFLEIKYNVGDTTIYQIRD